ncbi:hypothetical protein L9F63_011807, partial [Diploptera punctata]
SARKSKLEHALDQKEEKRETKVNMKGEHEDSNTTKRIKHKVVVVGFGSLEREDGRSYKNPLKLQQN